MKKKIQSLINLAIIASKFFFDYDWIYLILALAAANTIIDLIPHHRFSSRLEKKISKALQMGPIAINEHLLLESTGPNVENIQVFYDQEKVGSLIEFESYYPESYKKLCQTLESMLQHPYVEPEPVEEELSFASYISAIDAYNIEITDEEISLGLYHTSNQLKYLHQLMQEHPKTNKKITKLENYYLPILMDILGNYTKVIKTDSNAEKNLREQCHKSIVLINEALKNIIQTLYEEEKMNLHADMSVLENLLKKDGLVDVMEEKR